LRGCRLIENAVQLGGAPTIVNSQFSIVNFSSFAIISLVLESSEECCFMPLIIAEWLLEGLTWLIVAGAILSWFPAAGSHPVTRLIQSIINPLLTPFRAVLPRMGGIDFSPLLAIVLLTFLKVLLRPVY
jgi:uncharacterized protein YggT (Ycf19 family)